MSGFYVILRCLQAIAVLVVLFLAHCQSKVLNFGLDNQFVLGGLFPVHAKGSENSPCGKIKGGKGIQRLEAMMYALDYINKDEEFKNLSFGAMIIDTCTSDSHALKESLGFLKKRDCDGSVPGFKRVTAVVGASNSPVSEAIASIMRLYKVPQVSYASTSEELDNLHKYPYFFRVVPSDKYQIRAIFDIIKYMKWTYLSAVASEGEYGEKAVRKLQELMAESQYEDICLAAVEILPRNPSEKDYSNVIHNLALHNKARAVVVFLNEDKLRRLLHASSEHLVKFLWLGSDSWGAKVYPVHQQEHLADNAITILPKRFTIAAGFDEYFLSLKPDTNTRNPWFQEFWEDRFNCSFRDSEGKPECTGEERLDHSFQQEGLVPMVVDATLVIAKALRKLCTRNQSLCTHHINGTLLKEYIANVTFNSSQGNGMIIRFDKSRSIPVNYTIYQFRRIEENSREYAYIPIGEWDPERQLVLKENPKWTSASESSCSPPCKHGEERIRIEIRCCWSCRPCDGDNYLPNIYAQCTPCPAGRVPSGNHTTCRSLKEEYMGSDWNTPWALVPTFFSCFGTFCTICSAVIFLWYRETPVIKASGRELCYAIFLGIILCYTFTFVAVMKPSKTNCAALRIVMGLGLSVCYASIFTKTNRISRIFNRRFSTTKRPAYISPRSQLAIVLCLVAIQLVLSIMALIVSPANSKHHHLEKPRAHLITCKIDHISVMLGLIYNMVLIFLCTVYAYKTRNIPENFNEAKYISFTMYSSCIVWFAFVAIFSSTWKDFKVQSTVLCLSVSMSGTVVLFCLFFPKLYLVLFRPHKNIRHQDPSTHSGSAVDTSTPVRYFRSAPPSQPCSCAKHSPQLTA